MLDLSYIQRRDDNVPVLSGIEIDKLGELIVEDFCEGTSQIPQDIDIERFIEFYLEATLDYQYLSHNGCYLGMAVFNDTDCLPIFNPEENRAELISVSANTIIIDTLLVEERQKNRLRFTFAHEASHLLLHKPYYCKKHKKVNISNGPWILCRKDLGNKGLVCNSGLTGEDWMERQANSLAAAILMPKSAVINLTEMIKKSVAYQIYDNEKRYACLIREVAKIFDVSTSAAMARLNHLGLFDGGVSSKC